MSSEQSGTIFPTAPKTVGDAEHRRVETVHSPEARGGEAVPHLPIDRYRELGVLGVGGAGEVRRVHDRALNRLLAVKTLRPVYARHSQMIRRFIHEAQIVAQLEHPAIVPVHDLGQLPDGNWYLTMTEIRGKDFDKVIRGFHRGRAGQPLAGTYDNLTLRRLIDVFRTICTAVGFAHSKGVIHRDLKPENVMVGDYGEVLVVDWGLAKTIGSKERDDYEKLLADEQDDDWAGEGPAKTRYGVVAGTPAYMPPEQAAGRHDELGPWSDVWALGGILFSILYGQMPYQGNAQQVIRKVLKGPPVAMGDDAPEPLVELWRRAMQMDPSRRFQNAAEMVEEVDSYIEGSRAREKALTQVAAAELLLPDLEKAKTDAARTRQKARVALLSLRHGDNLEVKESAWSLDEEAERKADAVEGHYRAIAAKARAALAQVPELPEARALLAALYRERAEAAEEAGDTKTAQEYVALLSDYDDGTHADYLKAEGRLRMVADTPDAQVQLYRFHTRARRLVPVPASRPMTAPLEMAVPAGSYLAVIRAPGRLPARYPFRVDRGDTWDSRPPGQTESEPIQLLEPGALGPVDRYVPAGWMVAGGDGDARGGLGRQRLWVPGFVIQDRPVTVAEYLRFLNDLVERGHAGAATNYVPRMPREGTTEEPLFRWDSVGWDESHGRWVIPQGGNVDVVLSPDAPVVYVSWFDAVAYCRWYGLKTRQLWRLPGELEREKAARGADARAYPWGDWADPAFHCMQDSPLDHPGAPPTDEFKVDESPYFVHGLAGGVQEWCADKYQPYGPQRRGSMALPPEPPGSDDIRMPAHPPRRAVRGGAWNLDARACRPASRLGFGPERRANNLGFRLARSLEGG